MAPHIAAEREGVHISMPLLVAAFECGPGAGEFVVVEGVGDSRAG